MEKDAKRIAGIINDKKFVPKASKHIRWNYEQSDKYHMDSPLTNYHFVIVGKRDTFNDETLNKIYNSIISAGSFVEKENILRGRVHNSEFRYLFTSCHALAPKEVLRLEKFGCPIVFDKQLVKKKVLGLEDYVYRLYE